MATGKGNYLSDKILDHVIGGNASYTRPANVYVALYTAVPTEGSGTSGTEVVGGSYTRVAIVNDDTKWGPAVSGKKTNLDAFEFPRATANWGTVRGAALWDAASGGNLLYWGAVVSVRVVSSGDKVRVPVGGAIFGES